MAETIWSVIAVVGGLGMVVVILYFLVTGRNDREREEEARRFFDEHGHWPDETPEEAQAERERIAASAGAPQVPLSRASSDGTV
jgi:hypothetical protein